MTDILDIKPILKVSVWWVWVGALLLLGLILFLVLRLRRRKEKPVVVPKVVRTLSPREWALQEMEILDRAGLVERGQFRKYFFRLSEIIRQYLQDEAEIPAVDATTEEIRPHLKHSTLLSAHETARMEAALEAMDLIKFARLVPPPEEVKGLRQDIRQFIETAPAKKAMKIPPPAPELKKEVS